jgi:hypothetical protein
MTVPNTTTLPVALYRARFKFYLLLPYNLQTVVIVLRLGWVACPMN